MTLLDTPLSLANGQSLARGQMARQVAGTDSVEIKATIDAPKVRKALKLLGLKPNHGELRLIYFFDTPKLALFRTKKTIIRARRVPGCSHDSTVKRRPVDPKSVPGKWHKHRGFKLEADAGEKGIVRSASLSQPLTKGQIKDAVARKKPVSELFDDAQKTFLAEVCEFESDIDGLAMLGPISALWWKISHPGLPVAMTAELWTREDKETMLEVSIRVPAAQAAFAAAGFMAFLAELGAKRENAQQTKTLWALEYYGRRSTLKENGHKRTTAKAQTKAAKKAALAVVKKHRVASAKPKSPVETAAGAKQTRSSKQRAAAPAPAAPASSPPIPNLVAARRRAGIARPVSVASARDTAPETTVDTPEARELERRPTARRAMHAARSKAGEQDGTAGSPGAAPGDGSDRGSSQD